ncbi:hypothetical protein ACLI09_15215 [Flavobacterium sp. RHBU_24]|uniref:hypothetical protein n=1 Tax=Flavobacterium sp. RHBU_24 TaxID=3391185 RepID=UPI0039852CEE
MKQLLLAFLIIGFFSSCKDEKTVEATSGVEKLSADTTMAADDDAAVKEELARLIGKTMYWSESEQSINLLPVVVKDSICTGFDFDKHHQNLKNLKATGFFADEFISNYDSIIRTLDSKIKSGEFDAWNVYELPTFIFDNDVNPWCMCQDDPGDWNNVKVGIKDIDEESGDFFYYFGEELPTVEDYSYPFSAVKENGSWKISYMWGFNYENSITKDGELNKNSHELH